MLNQAEKQQDHQQQKPNTTVSYLSNTISSHISVHSSLAMTTTSTRRQALASNINELTEAKWKEIEMNVESFKSNLNNTSSDTNSMTNNSSSTSSIASSLLKKKFLE